MIKKYLIDTHAHIDMGINGHGETLATDTEIEENIRAALENGVKKIIIPAVDTRTLDRIVEIAEKHENIYCMTGIFPTEAKTFTPDIEAKMITLAQSKKVRAIGEIGLDYYWEKETSDLQKKVFVKQIKLANKLNLPIVVHDREAHKDCFDLLKEHNKNSRVLFHCFSGSAEFMRECVKEGYYIAIGGVVTFKNAIKLKEVAKSVPLERLVLETDSPYLTPVPYRGKPNKPAYIKYVAEEISKLREVPVEEIISVTTQNAEEFFGI